MFNVPSMIERQHVRLTADEFRALRYDLLAQGLLAAVREFQYNRDASGMDRLSLLDLAARWSATGLQVREEDLQAAAFRIAAAGVAVLDGVLA